MKYTFNVTKEIIEKSVELLGVIDNRRSRSCPVALALREKFPNASMGYTWATIQSSDDVKVPKEVTNFINKFDNTSNEEKLLLEPFSFTLDIK